MKIWSYSLVIENGGVFFFLTTSLIYIWKEITVNSCPQQINLKDVIHWCLLCWYFVYLNICTSIRNIYVLKLYNVTSLLSWFNDLEWFKNSVSRKMSISRDMVEWHLWMTSKQIVSKYKDMDKICTIFIIILL